MDQDCGLPLMHHLAKILIQERWRTALARQGRSGAASLALLLAAFGCLAGVTAGRMAGAEGSWQPATLNAAWLAWVLVGVLVGKDFTWTVGLERLKTLPLRGFSSLYALGFGLSFVSYPLLVVLVSAALSLPAVMRADPAGWLRFLAGWILLVVSVRSISSLVRVVVHLSGGLERNPRIALRSTIPLIVAWIAAGMYGPDFHRFLPGGLFGLVLEPRTSGLALFGFAVADAVLVAADYAAQKVAVYSGVSGPSAGRHRLRTTGRLLTLHPEWPSPLWRISLLGWLRNRNATMLLLWGMLYGCVYLYLTRPDSPFDYIVFSWMVLVFHAYLRGNLLGVDHSSAWVYYMFPAPVEEVLVAKNRTLSLLQACMVAAVLVPAVLRPIPGTKAGVWISIVIGVYSTVLLGEVAGTYFSVRFPEPIDRRSHFSGGMSAGGLVIPVCQAAFFVTFLIWAGYACRRGITAAFWLGALAVPVLLLQLGSILVHEWARRMLETGNRTVLIRLSGISS